MRFVVAPADSYEHYKTDFRNARAPIATFGDSHVANAITSTVELVNLGYRGDTLHLMLVKASAYVSFGHANRVILQYAPELFSIYRAANRQAEVAEDLLSDNVAWFQFLRPHFRGYLLSYWNAVLQDPERITEAFSKASPPSDPEPQPLTGLTALSPAEQRRLAEIRVQLHAPLPQGSAIEALLETYSEALREFRRKGIDICIVEYPLSEPYRVAAAQAPTFSAMAKRFAGFAADERVRFVDLKAAMPNAAFADPDHLAAHARIPMTDLVLDRCFGAARSVKLR